LSWNPCWEVGIMPRVSINPFMSSYTNFSASFAMLLVRQIGR
jgi:hypothetical protein